MSAACVPAVREAVESQSRIHLDAKFRRALEAETKRDPSLYLDEIYEKAVESCYGPSRGPRVPCFIDIHVIIREIRTRIRRSQAAKAMRAATAGPATAAYSANQDHERTKPLKKRKIYSILMGPKSPVADSFCKDQLLSGPGSKRLQAPEAPDGIQTKKPRSDQENSPPVPKPQGCLNPMAGSGSVTIWRPCPFS